MTVPKKSALLQLATSVLANTQQLVDRLQEQETREPSLDASFHDSDFIAEHDTELLAIRDQIVDASRALADTLVAPKRHLLEISQSCLINTVLDTVCIYKLPQLVPLDTPISYSALSAACGLDEDALQRVVRYAIHERIFSEPSPGHVAHSSLSMYLATNPSAFSWLSHCCEDVARGAAYQTEAFRKYPNDLTDPKHCGWSVINGKTYFETLGEEPSKVARFADAMKWVATASGFHSASAVVHSFDWKSLPTGAKMVDVGGSTGHNSVTILQAVPGLHAIVQDLPEVIAQQDATKLPTDVQNRVQFQAHSFFEPQPITDADVYFFRAILHDWPDAKSREILANTVPSMKSGARIMFSEITLLQPGEGSYYEQRWCRAADIHMMVCLSGREKTVEDWDRLVLGGEFKGMLVREVTTSQLIVYKKL